MANCRVILENSFKLALVEMPERARDQVAVVIGALETCKFEPDSAEYILQVHQYVSACEHVEGWGWSVSWYFEDGSIFVNAAPSTRIRLLPKTGG